MKGIVSIILLSILYSCSDTKENNQVSDTSADADTTSLITSIDSGNFINKVEHTNPTTPIGITDLKGKTFVLGGGIDENVCEIAEACDCCNADLMFITENQFVSDDLCEGHYVRRGTYKLEGNKITLEFGAKLVSYHHNEESETNPNAPESVLEEESKPISKETYTIGNCKEFTIITNNGKSKDIAFPVGIFKRGFYNQGKDWCNQADWCLENAGVKITLANKIHKPCYGRRSSTPHARGRCL
ncbi:hypothetical protein [Rufibacter tibetensis]|uniref:Lipoprotein n=1 Tax=Rufibacter tibetensis TaxID=512763 RepID=A0A0P0CAR5_9BACT|nr:hypothetical protein [Rufibacter tibetensis]ALJ00738.1 hypothetical protein DC20_19330 [Rufibacter tibetensis]